MLSNLRTGLAVAAMPAGFPLADAEAQEPRNLVLFIADGLRALAVTPQTASGPKALRQQAAAAPENYSFRRGARRPFVLPAAWAMEYPARAGNWCRAPLASV